MLKDNDLETSKNNDCIHSTDQYHLVILQTEERRALIIELARKILRIYCYPTASILNDCKMYNTVLSG
jgi:hypothetical protein